MTLGLKSFTVYLITNTLSLVFLISFQLQSLFKNISIDPGRCIDAALQSVHAHDGDLQKLGLNFFFPLDLVFLLCICLPFSIYNKQRNCPATVHFVLTLRD